MKGTDLKQWHIDAAEDFVRGCHVGQIHPANHDQRVAIKFGELVRLVAWYGQIRAQAVADGAKVDEPGGVVRRKSKGGDAK